MCNRMRAVLSAARAAEALCCDVRVAWNANAECACRFGDVFEYPFPPAARLPQGFSVDDAGFCDLPASRRNLWLPAMARLLLYRTRRAAYRGDSEEISALLARGGRVYVSTCYEFCDGPLTMAALFRPSARVAVEVERLSQGFDACTVGMHIRTGDNAMSLRHSPARLFAERARAEISRNPHVRFFLATDSSEVKDAFVSEFAGHIVTSRGDATRSSLAGMTAAAADLFTLACTTRIYGSYYSSFSGTAAELGGIPLETLKL